MTTILTVLRFAFTSFKRTVIKKRASNIKHLFEHYSLVHPQNDLKPIAIKLNSSAISYLIRALKLNNVIASRYAFLEIMTA